MRGHDDEAHDKALFSKMMKKAMPKKKVEHHLKKDMREARHGISEDKKLIKTVRGARGR
jgi:hypothetical protein